MGMRIFLAALGFAPLLAPYELLLKVDWQHFMSPAFLMAALISLGAMGLSAFLFFAAFAGISSRMVFDKRTATFSYAWEAPVIRRTSQEQALSDIRSAELGVREWSDGEPSYCLRINMKDGTVFESDSSWSREEIEQIRFRVTEFLAPDMDGYR